MVPRAHPIHCQLFRNQPVAEGKPVKFLVNPLSQDFKQIRICKLQRFRPHNFSDFRLRYLIALPCIRRSFSVAIPLIPLFCPGGIPVKSRQVIILTHPHKAFLPTPAHIGIYQYFKAVLRA